MAIDSSCAATLATSAIIIWFINFIAIIKSVVPGRFKHEAPPQNLEYTFDAWACIARNTSETVPLSYVVFVAALLAGADPVSYNVLVIAFTVLRALYAVLYLNKIQPYRTLCFMFHQLCVGIVGILGLLAGYGVYL
mmetsp:Transcript_12668/g.27083  ORF Transcript_12668/g.27083 Transcript_12668/m.27083 type:complete len:136 (+) Transcript_12668:36-443(+)